jgi:hypothetical protein
MRLKPAFLALALLLLLPGCALAPSGPFAWWTHRGERAAEKADATHTDAREAQLAAARLESVKTAQAAAVLPPSPEAMLTQRFAGNTADLLAQAVPGATAEQLAAVRQLVSDLRSEDAKVVAAAQARQAATEGHNAALSRELAATAERAAAAEAKASQIADKNADLAASLLWMKFAAATGAVLSAVSGLAVVAFRSNMFGMATATAGMLADLQREHGAGIASIARKALDVGLNRGEQTQIAKAFRALAPDLASGS